jgi:hypothetical protein
MRSHSREQHRAIGTGLGCASEPWLGGLVLVRGPDKRHTGAVVLAVPATAGRQIRLSLQLSQRQTHWQHQQHQHRDGRRPHYEDSGEWLLTNSQGSVKLSVLHQTRLCYPGAGPTSPAPVLPVRASGPATSSRKFPLGRLRPGRPLGRRRIRVPSEKPAGVPPSGRGPPCLPGGGRSAKH